MEAAGMPGLRGVYGHGPGGRAIMVVSIKQGYIGHAKEALFLAAASLSGSMAAKTIIVVDVDIVRGHKTSQTDPSLPPHKIARGDISMGRVLIDACRPYYRYNKFAPVNIASDELRSKIAEKYVALLNSF
jgi:hypothetical protein